MKRKAALTPLRTEHTILTDSSRAHSTGPGLEGVCIEIGSGSGFWVDIFSDKHMEQGTKQSKKSNRKKVTRVYGVEPNRDQHFSRALHIPHL
jgi:hypothetical protein